MTKPNILLVAGDDIGLDRWARFNRGNNYPNTPTVNSWFDGGVAFTRFYVQQLCSPTRATIQTGIHPTFHGIGELVRGPLTGIPSDLATGLSAGLPNIPRLLRRLGGYRTMFAGKFHLGTDFSGGTRAPNLLGYEHAVANLFNLQAGGDNPEGYYDWDKVTDGEMTREHRYHTKQITDEAIEWIQQRGTQPWFCCFAPYACHIPLGNLPSSNVPPAGTYNAGTWPNASSNQFQNFNACTEALDFYLARFATELPLSVWRNTIVIFCTDNGSPDAFLTQVTDPLTGTMYPSGRAKDSPYDMGIHTPLIFYSAGNLIPAAGSTKSALVSAVDILPTILDYAGVQTSAEFAGFSLRPHMDGALSPPLHKSVYSECFLPNGAKTDIDKQQNQWAIYDGQFVLIYNQDFGVTPTNALYEFYDLTADPHQLTNLTPLGVKTGLSTLQRNHFDDLLSQRTALVAQ